MRTIAPIAIALAGMSLTSAFAAAGTWCGTFRLGSTSCGYSSAEECYATVRGLGGFCQPNPSARLLKSLCPAGQPWQSPLTGAFMQ